jgi:hypothetical protein
MGVRCSGVGKDGLPCKAYAMKNRDVCCFHAPELQKEGQAKRRMGGRKSQNINLFVPLTPGEKTNYPLGTVADLASFLGICMNECHRGELDPKTAGAIGTLAGALSKCLEDISDVDLAKQVDELRRLARARPVLRDQIPAFLTMTKHDGVAEVILNEPKDE